ncbi:enhanced serine sensitivity protein SseB [Krasilnikovia sp. M28-CT-15]
MAFPANALERALAGAHAGETSPDQLLQALADSQLWVPLPAGADENGATPLPIVILDGRPHVAAYTSAEQYARGAGTQAHMVLTGRELADLMAAELGLAVNAGAELGLPVNPSGVRRLRGGTVRSGTRMRLGLPAEEPEQLLAALAAAFARIPGVSEARRALAQVGDEPPALLIGIRSERPGAGMQHDDVLTAVRDSTAEVPAQYPVETVFLNDPSDPITAWMLRNTEPFYQRTMH